MDFSKALILDPDLGSAVSAEVKRFGEILQEYDSDLSVRIVPGHLRRAANTKPYAVVCRHGNNEPYVIFYFGEKENKTHLLARIINGDSRSGRVLDRIESLEKAEKITREKLHQEELLQAADEMHFLMTSRSKNYVKWKDLATGKIVKLDSDRRRVT